MTAGAVRYYYYKTRVCVLPRRRTSGGAARVNTRENPSRNRDLDGRAPRASPIDCALPRRWRFKNIGEGGAPSPRTPPLGARLPGPLPLPLRQTHSTRRLPIARAPRDG